MAMEEDPMRNRLVGIVAAIGMILTACGGATSDAAGPSEGIQVHGDWTIEIYNADGTLDERFEFSNSLTQYGSYAISNALVGGTASFSKDAAGRPEFAFIVLADLGGESPCGLRYDLGIAPHLVNPTQGLEEVCLAGLSHEEDRPTVDPQPPFPIVARSSRVADFDGVINYVETVFGDHVLTWKNLGEAGEHSVRAGQTIDVEVIISFATG
jgi:hypothetical protein